MQNRIFQVAGAPVSQEDYITEGDFIDHWFIGSVADYMDGRNDRVQDIRDLRRVFTPGIARFYGRGRETASFAILPSGKEAYFTRAYAAFVTARGTTAGLGLEQFSSASAFGDAVSEMSSAFCTELETYVSLDNESGDPQIMPLDTFVRVAETGKRYYIGGVLGYHY